MDESLDEEGRGGTGTIIERDDLTGTPNAPLASPALNHARFIQFIFSPLSGELRQSSSRSSEAGTGSVTRAHRIALLARGVLDLRPVLCMRLRLCPRPALGLDDLPPRPCGIAGRGRRATGDDHE